MAAARLKVLAALPPELRARAARLVERFHLDAAGWFHAGEAVPHLPVLADAVWEGRIVEIDYERGDRLVHRRVQPLGLVLKAGVWYLVARSDEQIRTYRVARVASVETDDGAPFERPAEFDLAAYWAESSAAYERGAPRIEVSLRIDPDWLPVLADVAGVLTVRQAERLSPAGGQDPDGWQHLRLRMEWPNEVPARLLALGDRAEVLDPPEVQQEMLTLVRQVAQRYAVAQTEPLVGLDLMFDLGLSDLRQFLVPHESSPSRSSHDRHALAPNLGRVHDSGCQEIVVT